MLRKEKENAPVGTTAAATLSLLSERSPGGAGSRRYLEIFESSSSVASRFVSELRDFTMSEL